MKPTIRTSYYAAKQALPSFDAISISNSCPGRFYGTVRRDLAPAWAMVEAWRQRRITWAQFTEAYTEKLKGIDLQALGEELQGKTLLCWESASDPYCHRHLLARMLQEAGFEVEEG
ncbi:MAG: hypothetical protein WCK39_08140 [Methanomassiliicoccales archaeon]